MVLALLSLIFATLFTGAALYISLVEHPARLLLDDGPLLAQWQPSYKRALPIQASLAILGGLAGIAAWLLLGDWRLLAGALFMLANWPLTMIVIMPINKRLQATPPSEAGLDSRALLIRWGRLHDMRSALGSAAVLLFAWGQF
ncbi:MAG: DUF1772 domain-containing protein [Sphingobium sp.]|nr:DUF1772 domain-containing protein [Sphingobium sp.]